MIGRWHAAGGRLALGLVAAAAASPLPWPAPLAATLLTLSLGFAPGALLAPVLLPRAGVAGRALFALATAPFLAGGAMALALALGATAASGARLILMAIAAAGLASALWPRSEAASVREAEGAVPWLAAAVWTAGVAALLFGNPWLAPRSDGWFHAAVVLQMTERTVPPEDPYFAGLQLLYFWGYHAWAVAWTALAPRLGVWAPMIALNLTAATAVILGVCLLARRLGATKGGMWLAAAVATLGYSPFSWVWILLRAVTGDVVGADEIRRLVTMGASPAMQIMGTWQLHSSMAFFGDKFLVLTPFSLGLAQFTLVVRLLLDFTARPTLRAGLALGVAVAAAMFIHSVVGWASAMLAGTWWWWALWRSRRPDRRPLRAVLLPLLIVFEAVVALLMPYLAVTTLGKEGTLAPGFSLQALATWLLAGLLVVPAGTVWLWRQRRRDGALDLLFFSGVLTVAGLSIWLPGNNQSKFFNLLLLLLAAPAGLGLHDLLRRARGRRRALLAAGLVAATAPTVTIAIGAFATERAQFGADWQHPGPGVLEAMRWARTHTPPNAVFVDAHLSLDLPVRAGRSVITGGPRWEQNWRYPEPALRVRRETAGQLGALEPCSDAVREFLNGLGRPVFVVRRRPREAGPHDGWDGRAGDRPGYQRVFANDETAIYLWSARP